jgi:hypothetical protein
VARTFLSASFVFASANYAVPQLSSATLVTRTSVTTSVPNDPPGPRLILPSITDLIFILLLVSLTYGTLAPRLLGDADVGWHIRNGDNILSSHAIPRTDSFSATLSNQTWYSWEWLFDLLVGIVHRSAGLNGVVFLSALVISFTLALVFRTSLQRGGAAPITIVLFVLCLVGSSIHFLARPHVLSWLLAVIWFRVLDRFETDNRALRLWTLPALMVIWANLHGGFVLGFVLVGIFMVAQILECIFGSHSEGGAKPAGNRAFALGIVLLICVLASLANPYGYKLHVHVYRYLTNRFFMQHIDEFRTADLHGLPAQFFLLLIAMTIAGIILARFQLRWSEWLLVAFSVFSGLWGARNIPFAAMLLTMVAAPLFSRSLERREISNRFAILWNKRIGELDTKFSGHLWPAALVVLTLFISFHDGKLFGRQLVDANFDPKRFPAGAVEHLAQSGNREPIFSLDSWGGYLIYRRYPDQKVIIDDRHDFYGEAYLRDYLTVLHAEPGWDGVLRKWGANLVVFPTKSKLSEALRQAGWKPTYEDETAVIFVR